eukprot:IDg7756t1
MRSFAWMFMLLSQSKSCAIAIPSEVNYNPSELWCRFQRVTGKFADLYLAIVLKGST